MTVSILDTLATLPSGEQGVPLTFEELGRYLRENYRTDAERDINRQHRVRDAAGGYERRLFPHIGRSRHVPPET